MNKNIRHYYNDLATTYDTDRFGNSYGQYLHKQEALFLNKHLTGQKTLNLGCGTGRFMEFATIGLDISQEMIGVAQSKFPNKSFFVSDATQMPFENNAFNAIFCLHVFMHLPTEKAIEILTEVGRILPQGGQFIVDFPSLKRRNGLGTRPQSWHGGSAYSIEMIEKLITKDWLLTTYEGILFLPIHRMPTWLRPFLRALDSWLCNSFLKQYASYLIISLEKK
jgi:ubiquinone/menaquinone biosynthesis C-methylase UbiE